MRWNEYTGHEGDIIALLAMFSVALLFGAGVAWMNRRERRVVGGWEVD